MHGHFERKKSSAGSGRRGRKVFWNEFGDAVKRKEERKKEEEEKVKELSE